MDITTEQKREALRRLGFIRQDRTIQGERRELWRNQYFRNGLGQPLKSCWNHVVKYDFVTACQETGKLIFWDDKEDRNKSVL